MTIDQGTTTAPADATLKLVARAHDGADTPSFDVFGLTDVGRARARNEDQFLIADLSRTITVRQTSIAEADTLPPMRSCQARLLVVADGMGGHGGGDLASSVATDAVADYVFETMPWFMRMNAERAKDLTEELRKALMRCQSRIRQVEAQKGLVGMRMGTTLTLAYVIWPDLYVLHAGDSRCYLARGGKLWRMTTDHTMAQQLVNSQMVTADQVAPRFHNILVNAVGGGTDDLTAEVHRVDLALGDVLLLCTDGLTKYVSDDEFAAQLASSASAEACCRALVEAANQRGGGDNITAVVARFI